MPRAVRAAGDGGGARDAEAAAPDTGPTPLEALAARKDRLAPGMRELLRTDLVLSGPRDVPLALADGDTCVRAAFDADGTVRVSLGDASGPLADAGAAHGALGRDGPVCVRKGATPVLHLDGSGRVRVVVWASP